MRTEKSLAVIPGRCEAAIPESRDSPMCNCTSEVWCNAPSRNDGGSAAILHFDTEALVCAARRPLLMSTIDLPVSPSDLRAVAEQSNAWPFEQAKQIVARLKKKSKDEVLFATGYGPSGLPHIGTFGE